MPRELIGCQCDRDTEAYGACERAATAEDFLCDGCRDGCSTLVFDGGPTLAHVYISEFGSIAELFPRPGKLHLNPRGIS